MYLLEYLELHPIRQARPLYECLGTDKSRTSKIHVRFHQILNFTGMVFLEVFDTYRIVSLASSDVLIHKDEMCNYRYMYPKDPNFGGRYPDFDDCVLTIAQLLSQTRWAQKRTHSIERLGSILEWCFRVR